MSGIALALGLRGLDRALESVAIASARVELAGFYLARLPAELRRVRGLCALLEELRGAHQRRARTATATTATTRAEAAHG